MKAILMSIRPQHTCNILNDIKWWEIRKKFPKDYVGWVYIYCTKGKEKLITFDKYLGSEIVCGYDCTSNKKHIKYGANDILNGKVVARFWCDKVVDFWNLDNIMLAETCLTKEELGDYLGFNKGYAIHITKLEIFNEPKEIGEFYRPEPFLFDGCWKCPHLLYDDSAGYSIESCELKKCEKLRLTKAPQSWCYVEV